MIAPSSGIAAAYPAGASYSVNSQDRFGFHPLQNEELTRLWLYLGPLSSVHFDLRPLLMLKCEIDDAGLVVFGWLGADGGRNMQVTNKGNTI